MTKPAYRKNTKTFSYTNTHPNDAKGIGDCVFRAISIATGKDWLVVYDELTALGRELLAPPNDKLTYATYLDKIASRVPAIVDGKRLLPTQLPKSGTYVVRQANHLTCVKDGKVRDTWNTTDRSSYLIWKVA